MNRRAFITGIAAASVLTACGGGGGGGSSAASTPTPPNPAPPAPPPVRALRDAFAGQFTTGVAIGSNQLTDAADVALVQRHFGAITAEYEMKADVIAPTSGTRNFAPADRLLTFAAADGLAVRGHTLLWHQTTPSWLLAGSRTGIRARLEAYVHEVVGRYAGRILAWDVVNEMAADTPGSDLASAYRQSPWLAAAVRPPARREAAPARHHRSRLRHHLTGLRWSGQRTP